MPLNQPNTCVCTHTCMQAHTWVRAHAHTHTHTCMHTLELELEASYPKIMLSRGCGHAFLYHWQGRVVVQECLNISCFLWKERWQVAHTNGLSGGGTVNCWLRPALQIALHQVQSCASIYQNDSLSCAASNSDVPCPANKAWPYEQNISEVSNQTTASLGV